MVALELVFLTLIATFNMIDLLCFPFEAVFLNRRKYSVTLYLLLYMLNYNYNVSELLC